MLVSGSFLIDVGGFFSKEPLSTLIKDRQNDQELDLWLSGKSLSLKAVDTPVCGVGDGLLVPKCWWWWFPKFGAREITSLA